MTAYPTLFRAAGVALAVVCLGVARVSPAAQPATAELEHFEKKVRPLLVKYCFKCHGPKEQEADLRLDSRAAVLRGGESGPAIEPGRPAESRLVRAIGYSDPDLQMPPKKKLSARQIADLTRWVKAGAPWPEAQGTTEPSVASRAIQRPKITDEQRKFWAFRPVVDRTPPKLADESWATSPIDRFIGRALDAKGLKPAPPADKRTLLRRIYFDLIGLPPAPEEIEAYLADDSPKAFAKVVDRLLASEHYGERWARHWLDLVRYSETDGHVQDNLRPHAWKYRDWVIDALNDDLPYDRFIIEQIAGDLLTQKRPGKRGETNVAPVATGMLWMHEMHFKPVDPPLQRADQVDAQIDVIGKAFLGLTLACARCHAHKFDPISHHDYYALAGFFHSTAETQARTAPRTEVYDAARAKKIRAKEKQIAAAVGKAIASARRDQLGKSPIQVPITEDNFGPGGRKQMAKLRAELARLDPSSTQWARSAGDVEPRDVRLHVRGSYKNPGPVVPRAFLEILDGERKPDVGAGSGRLWLAGKIADPDNPLTARVMVNRLWQHHFGEGLVRTPSSFGQMGERPTHPRLLDYLAARFIEGGWSLKAMHRRMVLSSTYRMSSRASAKSARVDPENKLLSRMPIRRLEAEAIHDAILTVTGSLDRTVGGPSIPPFVSPNATSVKPIHLPKAGPIDSGGRRAVYVQVRRNFITPMFETFDFPNPGASVGRRDVTIVPSQALAMMNGPLVHRQAAKWGKAIAAESGSDEEKIARMFVRALGRPPNGDEYETLLSIVAAGETDKAWVDVAHVILNLNDFVFVR
ncbi:MAG: PSD1 domain-containing protein [Planctomycetes bacterium]|nr:PSD1 domain-containing protein [Planctomycetota bacterium]